MRRLLLVLLAALSVLAACGGDDDDGGGQPVALDGSPRPADAEGRLVEVEGDFSTITLDGDRTYAVAEEFLSFAAVDGEVQPLLRWENQYVQVGLDGDEVVWLGGISAVVEVDDEPPVAYFTDVLTEVAESRATFRSGTVLTVGAGVEVPEDLPAAVVATIDVTEHEVTAFEPG